MENLGPKKGPKKVVFRKEGQISERFFCTFLDGFFLVTIDRSVLRVKKKSKNGLF